MRRVVITGMGSLNGLGHGVPVFLSALREARCAVGDMSLFPTDGFRTHRGAVVDVPELPARVPSQLAARLSRPDRMAVIAAEEAWRAADLHGRAPASARLGVALGGTTAGMLEAEEGHRRSQFAERPPLRLREALGIAVSTSADVLSLLYGARGPRVTLSTACSSSANAIGMAVDWIRAGRCDVVLAGGSEGHCRLTYAGFNALQALDPDVCRPFDRRRAGLSLGEGAAFFVLEAEDRARSRNAPTVAEVVGYGVSADAHHMTAPDPQGRGAVLAMRRALADAEVGAGDVEYVNAHGTGTPANDPIETRALHEVFGAAAPRLWVSSTKSQVGHCLGAAGAIEILATALALRHGFAPPTVNLEEPDPACDLDYVPRHARERRLRVALSNSYGFGGNNTSVVLRAVDP